jgi:hypothetical protein
MNNEAPREFARRQWTRLVLFLRFCRMNVVAYSAILRVTVTERLWSAPAPKRHPATGSRDQIETPV